MNWSWRRPGWPAASCRPRPVESRARASLRRSARRPEDLQVGVIRVAGVGRIPAGNPLHRQRRKLARGVDRGERRGRQRIRGIEVEPSEISTSGISRSSTGRAQAPFPAAHGRPPQSACRPPHAGAPSRNKACQARPASSSGKAGSRLITHTPDSSSIVSASRRRPRRLSASAGWPRRGPRSAPP
jgi:hypothetical protein